MKTKTKSPLGLLQTIVFVLSWIFFGLLAGIVFCIYALGFHAHPILSGSMEPNMMTGSMAIVKNVPTATLQKGDVIAFYTPEGTGISHRIVSIDKVDAGYKIVTKGDNNNAIDKNPYIAKNPELGKIFYAVPYLGYAYEKALSRNGAIVGGVLLGLIVLIMFWPSDEDENDKEESRPVVIQADNDTKTAEPIVDESSLDESSFENSLNESDRKNFSTSSDIE